MFAHFTKMAIKALLRFKLHSLISLFSLVFGFMCFIGAVLLSNYTQSFDQHFPNSGKIYNVIQRSISDRGGPDSFPIINQPAARFLRVAFPEIPNIVRASTGYSVDVTIDDRTTSFNMRAVEPRFFDIFPLETISGLAQGEDLPPNSVLITEAAALKEFGTTDVLGKRLLLANSMDVAIVGVTAAAEFPSHLASSIPFFDTDIFVPIELTDARARRQIAAAGGDPNADRWGNQSDYVYIEFPEDMQVDVGAFNQRLDAFVKSTLPAERITEITYELLPVNKLVTSQLSFVTAGFDITSILVVAGALVLLIGCLNYSNLIIAQLSLRSQEIGVQKILGAKRSLLVLQYCYESLLFVTFSLGLTLLVFYGVLSNFQSNGMVGVGPAMLFSAELWVSLGAVVVLIVAIAGGYPALRTAMVSLVAMMRPKGSSGHSGHLRSVMVGLQFFISGTLMIVALVMYSQNVTMTQELDGETADPKIVISVPINTYTADAELFATELRAHPGILSTTQVDRLPWSIGVSTMNLSRSADLNATTIDISNHNVNYDFMETLDMEFLGGRSFSRDRANDLLPVFTEIPAAGGPYAVIINDRTARSLGWENAEAAIGKTLYRHTGPPEAETKMSIELTVVGAVGPHRFEFISFSFFGIGGDAYTLSPDSANYMIVRIDRENINDSLKHIDDTWNRLMPRIALKRDFIDNLFFENYSMFQSISLAIGVLSTFGFVIASIGLLGNATFITNMRQKEVGIRKVMGASSGRLLRMLLLDFAKPIIIANAIAWPLGYVASSAYLSIFSTRTEIGFTPFLISFALSVLIAGLAVISQSWKSARVRPAIVLRYE